MVAVNVATSPLNTELPPDRLTGILIDATRNPNRDFLGAILYNNLTGYKAQLNSFYDYGSTNYIYGLPVTNISNNEVNAIEVKVVLDVLEAEAVTIVDSFLYEPIPLVWALWWLYQNDGTYDFTANTLVQDAITWDVVNATINIARTQITVILDDNGTPGVYDTIITSIPNQELYYEVEYYKNATSAIRHIWLYKASLGTHPTLDINDTHVFDPIFPVVPIRLDDVSINADKESELYLTSKALLKKVKMDLDDLVEGVTKKLNDDGDLIDIPDLNLISDIFYLYALNIYGQTQIEKKALYILFTDLEAQSRATKITYDAQIATNGAISNNTFLIDAITFNFEITYNYITITAINGSIMEPDQYSVSHTVVSNYSHNRPDDIDDQIVPRSYITIRHQNTASEYTEIVVQGLFINHEIKSIRGIISSKMYITTYTAGSDLTDAQKNFIIPLSINTVSSLSHREANQLIAVIGQIQAYASDSQKLKWYQSAFFSAFLKVVAFIFIFWDWTGTASEFFWLIVKTMAIQYTFEYVLRELLEHYSDNEVVTFLIQIAAVTFLYFAFPNELIILTPVDKLLLVINSVSQVSIIKATVDLDLLEKERLSFEVDLKAAEEALAAANEFLKVDTLLDPSAIIDTRNYQYETPQGFIVRTLEDNPGELSIDHLHNYVDINLNLEYIRI